MAVEIDIVGSFTGKKAFKQADSQLGALDKTAAKLGKRLLALFSAQKVLAFSKQSISAFMADEKAAASLSNQLKNIGYSDASKQAESFIATLQAQTGILDDQLRPAYSQLARVTGSLQTTQKLMALAFDVASGTGENYGSVIDALSQAYVGNTKGLKKLNIGLTQAELKTKSFADITDVLSQKFKGSGAAALDTYAGKVALFEVTVANAQETIGKGFLDAFSQIANDGDFKTVTSTIDDMAQNVADTLLGIGAILGKIRNEYNGMPDWLKQLAKSGFKIAAGPLAPLQQALTKEGVKTRVQQSQTPGVTNFLEEQQANQTRRESIAAEAAAKKRQAELLAQAKQQNKLALNNLKLQKAAAVFDMKKIQITAALKSAHDEETVTRLKLMLAIENEQGDLAEKLQNKLDAIIAKNKDLQGFLDEVTGKTKAVASSLGDVSNMKINPFDFTGIYKGISDLDLLKSKVTELTGVFLDNKVAMASFSIGIAEGLSKVASISGARYAAQGAYQTGATDIFGNPTLSKDVGTNPTPVVVTPPPKVEITVNGAVDSVGTANQLATLLAGAAGATGNYSGLGYSWLASLGQAPA